ncbi:uracil-5--methyltransferase [Xylariaceae sp. FL0255]|nr:uracil-5--methyltransferase [Xylariaceae sp. FL0255]
MRSTPYVRISRWKNSNLITSWVYSTHIHQQQHRLFYLNNRFYSNQGPATSPSNSSGPPSSTASFKAFEALFTPPPEPPKPTQLEMDEKKAGEMPNLHGKRPFSHPQQKSKLGNKRQQKKARKRERDMKNGSHEEVLCVDIRNLKETLLKDQEDSAIVAEAEAEAEATPVLPEPGTEIEVKVLELSSTGDALAIQEGSTSNQIIVFPFGVPGDIAKVKVFRHLPEAEGGYTVADFISISTPSPDRNDSLIRCKYFGSCAGCQFQMLDYSHQLSLKKTIVEKAYANFSNLAPEHIPAVGDTIGSPLQYGYRTKLTPHFDGPTGWSRNKKHVTFEKRPDIGFTPKGKRQTLDIEDCPIGTDAVRMGLKNERKRMETEFNKYTRGATVLLRESTERVLKKDKNGQEQEIEESRPDAIKVETADHVDWKTCVTDNNGTSTEYVGNYVFHNPAGSFFQNNNSILPVFTDYIREHVLLPSPSTPNTSSSSSCSSDNTSSIPTTTTPQIKNLIDAYSGSGLFTITLSDIFFKSRSQNQSQTQTKTETQTDSEAWNSSSNNNGQGSSTGIDISESSITYARLNAKSNNLTPGQATFIAADATRLFDNAQVTPQTYPPDETVVILDPPRKGCDTDFLNQLLKYGPRRVVYVSCNVHTQARDVGVLVRGGDNEVGGEWTVKKPAKYAIESLCGFDFFPQTGHVEGVCVLNRVD